MEVLLNKKTQNGVIVTLKYYFPEEIIFGHLVETFCNKQ